MPYIENSLDDKTCEQVKLHIAECAKCSDEVSVLRNISGSLKKAAPCVEVAPDLWANVNAGITKGDTTKLPFGKLWLPRIAMAGSLGALIIAVIFAFNTTSQVEYQNITKNETRNPKINRSLPHDSISTKKVEAIIKPKTKSVISKKQSPASKPAPVMMAKLPPELKESKKLTIEFANPQQIRGPKAEADNLYSEKAYDKSFPLENMTKAEIPPSAESIELHGPMPSSSPDTKADYQPSGAFGAGARYSGGSGGGFGGNAAGGRVEQIQPNSNFEAKDNPKLDAKLQDLLGRTKVGNFSISKADAKEEPIEISIQMINPPDDALSQLQKIGIKDNTWIEQNSKLKCKVSIDKVTEIAKLDFVSKIALLN